MPGQRTSAISTDSVFVLKAGEDPGPLLKGRIKHVSLS